MINHYTQMGHQKQIAWRRNKVQELIIEGRSQTQIANILKVAVSTISADMNYLRDQAKENMQIHLQDKLPEEFSNCLAGINQVLQMCWDIARKGIDSSNSNSDSDADRTISATVDDRTRLQALALANDCYKYKMDLVTNGVVITDAIKFVQQQKQEINKMNSNSTTRSVEKEAEKRTEEVEEEEKAPATNSLDDIVDQNTKNKIF